MLTPTEVHFLIGSAWEGPPAGRTGRYSMVHTRSAFVVLGAHRSGTSAMARILNLAGLGALPIDLVPPHPIDNPTGFWESRPVIELNDAVLADLGGRWDRPPPSGAIRPAYIARAVDILDHQYGQTGSLVLKDPRISLLVPLWHEALLRLHINPFYLVMLRHPLEVAASLQARDRMGWEEAIAIWTVYMASASTGTDGLTRAFVAYDRLLADWRSVVCPLSPDPGLVTTPRACGIDTFLSSERKRWRRELLPLELDDEDAKRLYGALLEKENSAFTGSSQIVAGIEDEAPSSFYIFGEPIRFAEEGAAKYLVSGFSFREEWGRWTDGSRAVVSIRHGLPRGLLFVEIHIVQAFASGRDVADVVIRSGWSEPKLFLLTAGRSRIAFLAQAEEAEDQGSLRIEFLIVRPKSPDELPLDSRALGILIETITVSQISGAEVEGVGTWELPR